MGLSPGRIIATEQHLAHYSYSCFSVTKLYSRGVKVGNVMASFGMVVVYHT